MRVDGVVVRLVRWQMRVVPEVFACWMWMFVIGVSVACNVVVVRRVAIGGCQWYRH